MTLGTVACQAPLSMGFPRKEYWSGLSFLLVGIFLTQGLNCIGRQILYHWATRETLHWHYNHQSPWFTLEFSLSIVHSMSLGQSVQWHVSIVTEQQTLQNITDRAVSLPTIFCAPSIHTSLLTTPGNHWSFDWLHSFAFSTVSYSWNHIVCSLYRLTSFTYVHLSFFCVFSQFNSSFLFSGE